LKTTIQTAIVLNENDLEIAVLNFINERRASSELSQFDSKNVVELSYKDGDITIVLLEPKE
jgi:hypothetical protein